MFKKADILLVKTCDWFLHKILRSKWKRGSNQCMRTWYHYKYYGYLLKNYRDVEVPVAKNEYEFPL